MTDITVSAILVNYNAGEDLRRALQSIADELHDYSWQAIVVDNASTDGSAGIATDFNSRVAVIHNDQNVGFARGVNQGLAVALGRFVLVMNPDCRLVAGAIAELRAVLEAHQGCAIVGPKLLNPDGSVQGSARGDPDMWTGLFGRTGSLGRMLPWLPISRRNVVSDEAVRSGHTSVVVDWLSGACMFARPEALAIVHGFDERYFLYWEDADLCRRLRAAGYHVRYVPGATAIHRVGQSSRTTQAAAIRAFHASAYRYYTSYVAPSRFNPGRALARMILRLRCWLYLRRLRLKSEA